MALQDPSRTPPLRRGKRLFACAQYHKQRLRFPIDHARVYLFQARRASVSREIEQLGKRSEQIDEQVNGIEVVQAFARESHGERQFEAINYDYRLLNTRAIVLDATLDASIEMMSSICVAAVLWYTGGQSLQEQIDFGTLFAFLAYVDMFFLPVRNISARYTQLQSGLSGAERVFQLLSNEVLFCRDNSDGLSSIGRDASTHSFRSRQTHLRRL